MGDHADPNAAEKRGRRNRHSERLASSQGSGHSIPPPHSESEERRQHDRPEPQEEHVPLREGRPATGSTQPNALRGMVQEVGWGVRCFSTLNSKRGLLELGLTQVSEGEQPSHRAIRFSGGVMAVGTGQQGASLESPTAMAGGPHSSPAAKGRIERMVSRERGSIEPSSTTAQTCSSGLFGSSVRLSSGSSGAPTQRTSAPMSEADTV